MPESNSEKQQRRMRGWHRIGITASILGFLAGGFWGYKAVSHRADQLLGGALIECLASGPENGSLVERMCLGKAVNSGSYTGLYECLAGGPDLSSTAEQCLQQAHKVAAEHIRTHWRYVGLCALVPLVLGWPIAYVLITLVRWIRTGFKAPTSPN